MIKKVKASNKLKGASSLPKVAPTPTPGVSQLQCVAFPGNIYQLDSNKTINRTNLKNVKQLTVIIVIILRRLYPCAASKNKICHFQFDQMALTLPEPYSVGGVGMKYQNGSKAPERLILTDVKSKCIIQLQHLE